MNRILVLLAASTLLVPCLSACSDDSPSAPVNEGGAGGSSGGAGGAGGSSASAGGGGFGGGGAPVGGAPPAGGGGSDGGASAGQPQGGAAGAPMGPVQAVLGQRCTIASTIGVVQLAGFPAPYVQATLFDRPDPWVAEPELVTDTCAYHHYEPGACEACAPGETCSSASVCVPEPRSVKDATLVVSTASERREYRANAELGGLYSPLDIGDESSEYSMTLSWGETTITLPPMAVASGELVDLQVSIEGDSQAPGALDVTWEPSGQGGFVRSRIPINHHAAGPTFTDCAAPESAGSLHADADMVDPLAVKTGLEFQGVEHAFIAAAETEAGCVEFRFGTPILAFPN